MSSPATVPGPPAADRAWTLLIGGHPAAARSGRYYADESPVTEQVIAAVPDGGADDVDAAVRAAVPAAAQWRRVPARERGAAVAELAQIIERNAAELVTVTPLKALRW